MFGAPGAAGTGVNPRYSFVLLAFSVNQDARRL